MNWTHLNKKRTLFLLFVMGWGLVCAAANAQQSPFEQLKQKFEDGQVFHAQFTHRYIDSYTQDTMANAGEIWVARNAYKVESAAQTIVVDGETSKVYDSRRNRLIISTYVPEEDDFAPSRILNGIDSTYTVEQQQTEEGYLIQLSTDDPFALFQTVKITLNTNFIPVKIWVKDPADNLIITTFSSGSFIESTGTMFEMNAPADAEIIDMRN